MQILIVGASGYLGRHVYVHFHERYENVIGTYCTHRTIPGLIHFDLNADNMDWLNSQREEDNRCAIICAAESKFDACKINAAESFRTNVTSTTRLIERLRQMGYYIIFCSTDSVFDGLKGNYVETDQPCPINEYGETKRKVEQYIIHECPDVCIFRLSKMIGDTEAQGDTFREWKQMAIKQKDIYCIKDNFFAPVDVEDVAHCMELAWLKKVSGIYHVCGNKVYGRAELCRSFLEALHLEANVYEKELKDFGFCAERPLNVGMINQKVTDTLDYQFKEMEEIYKRYNI